MTRKLVTVSLVLVVLGATILSLALLPVNSVSAVQPTLAMETALVEHEGLVQEPPLAPTADTTLQEAHPTTNYGSSSDLILGRIDGGLARVLMEFNIGEIPLGATINSATLRIYQHGWYDYVGSVRTISVYRVTSAWHEAVATWNYAPTVGAMVGSVNVGMSTGWYEIDVTALAQEWCAGTTPNYGLLLRGYEGSENLYRLFTPRLYENQPQLVIDYTLQPTTLGVSTNALSFLTDGHKICPSSSVLRVSNGGTGVMSWSIDLGSTSWLNVNPTSGSTSASYRTPVEISILTDTLSVGIHTAAFTITASGAQNSPQVVDVTVNYSGKSLSEIYLPLVMRNSTGSPGTGAQTVALLVGIADYQYLGPPPSESIRTGDWGYDLEDTHQDPHHVYKPVTAFGGASADDTRILTDEEAPFANIQQAFAWADEREEKCPGVQGAVQAQDADCCKVFISYSGHGGQDAGGDYIVTAYDTNESGGNFTNAISAATLDSWLDNLESQRVFVAIDSCRSGGLLSGLSQSGRVVIAAARSDQSAWETNEFNGGVFTHYLVQGLMDPNADTNGDGCVSAEEVYNYAAGRTDDYIYSHTGYHQNPQIMDANVSSELCLTTPPPYGAMAAMPTITADEVEHPDAVFFSVDPVRLPTMVIPLR